MSERDPLSIALLRREHVFLSHPVLLSPEYNTMQRFPCIGLYHKVTGVPVAFPRCEQWILPLNRVELKADETLRKKVSCVCNFLNFILWKTTCNTLREVDLNVLRGWIESYRETYDGDDRDPLEWQQGICVVYNFLLTYIKENPSPELVLKPSDLFTPVSSKPGKKNTFWTPKESPNLLFVKPPRKFERKNRVLLEWHLELLLEEAQKYDTMLVPGIALQAYAGLREGEIVNISWSKISRIEGGYGQIRKVSLDLWDEAPYAKADKKKTGFGSIKIYRTQDVYPGFKDKVLHILSNHERYLISLGLSTGPDMPVLYNHFGEPMSVSTYRGRLKDLFYGRFVPALRHLSDKQGTWSENGPYIDAYERDYPAAHMLRHWYTMYLLTHEKLSESEVAKWRGDGRLESIQNYVHANSDMIDKFRNASISHQRSHLRKVLEV